VLNGLLKGEAVQFYFPATPGEDTAEALENIQRMMHGQALQKPAVSDHAGLPSYTCVMHRVGGTDVMVPVLVNDQPVHLQRCTPPRPARGWSKDVASSDYYCWTSRRTRYCWSRNARSCRCALRKSSRSASTRGAKAGAEGGAGA